jgi:hypothetical protein
MQHACPHTQCKLHSLGLCSFVKSYPEEGDSCPHRPIIEHDLIRPAQVAYS